MNRLKDIWPFIVIPAVIIVVFAALAFLIHQDNIRRDAYRPSAKRCQEDCTSFTLQKIPEVNRLCQFPNISPVESDSLGCNNTNWLNSNGHAKFIYKNDLFSQPSCYCQFVDGRYQNIW